MSSSEISRRNFFVGTGVAAAALLGQNTASAAESQVFRLGIVGSDNSHAKAFSELANVDGALRVPGLQVTHIWGKDPEVTAQRAKEGQIPNIVQSPEEMIGQVDGILNVSRHGGRHLAESLPFIEAGIPVFVDKPLACDVLEAEALIRAAQNKRVGFTSFSTVPMEATYQSFLAEVNEKAGVVQAGSVSGPFELDSEYGGVYFYGIHSVDLMLSTFGYDIETVQTTERSGHVHAACTFKSGALVSLQLLHNVAHGWHVNVFGEKGRFYHKPVVSRHYHDGLTIIKETLTTGKWPRTATQLLRPIQVLDGIDRSLKSGAAVTIS